MIVSTIQYNTEILRPKEAWKFRGGTYILHHFWNEKIHIHVFKDAPNNVGMSVTNCIEHLVMIEMNKPMRSEYSFFFEHSDSSIDFIDAIVPGPSWRPVVFNPSGTTHHHIDTLEEYVLGKILAGYTGLNS